MSHSMPSSRVSESVRRFRVILSRSFAKAQNPRICLSLIPALLSILAVSPARAQAPTGLISGQSILALTKQFLGVAPKRYNGSPGHAAAEKFIKDHFKPEAAHGNFEVDQFTANTPAGQQTMRNFIVKFPGKRDGAIVLVTHYETNYPLRNINFVGANDGACTTALLIAIGEYLRAHPPQGYAVWLVFDDGEEAVKDWNYQGQVDHTYGTRHLAAKWDADGTLKHVKALLIADMIGDKDLDILEDEQSTGWLRSIFRQAAINTRHTANIFKTQGDEQDDHMPFLERGVPSLDVIDSDYGPFDPKIGDAAYHHTAKDTIDKLSAQSLQTSADLFLETIRIINQQR